MFGPDGKTREANYTLKPIRVLALFAATNLAVEAEEAATRSRGHN